MVARLSGARCAAFVLPALVAACSGPDQAPADGARADVHVTVSGGTVQMPDAVKPGWRRVRVEEDGSGHIMVVFRLAGSLAPGDTAALLQALDTAAATPALATAVAGVARLGPGQAAYLPVDLPPGQYVMYCLVPDPASGQTHVELRMLKAISVE